LALENVALRHQLIVLQRNAGRPHLRRTDRVLWVLLSREAPNAACTGQQIIEAFPWDTAPRYLLRDRDGTYGIEFLRRVDAMGIEQVATSARSPWQNPFVESMIGTIRRECLDHTIVLNEMHLRRLLREYLAYYHGCRTHLGLGKDCPESRAVDPPERGVVVEMPMVGGLFVGPHKDQPPRRSA
jgi:transposase InsO family protein